MVREIAANTRLTSEGAVTLQEGPITLANHAGVSNPLITKAALQGTAAPSSDPFACRGVQPQADGDLCQSAWQRFTRGHLADQQPVLAEKLCRSSRVPGPACGHAPLPVQLPRAVCCEGICGQGTGYRALLACTTWCGKKLKVSRVLASVGSSLSVMAEIATHFAGVPSGGPNAARDVEARVLWQGIHAALNRHTGRSRAGEVPSAQASEDGLGSHEARRAANEAEGVELGASAVDVETSRQG